MGGNALTCARQVYGETVGRCVCTPRSVKASHRLTPLILAALFRAVIPMFELSLNGMCGR